MSTENDDEFLTIPEAAKIARAPLGSVRWWIHEGRLPSYRPGKRRLIKRSELLAFIASTASRAV